jgi:aspartyl-tRNA synthetase
MGDVNFNERIENNQGVVTGHVYSTAGNGVRIAGSSVRIFAPSHKRSSVLTDFID